MKVIEEVWVKTNGDLVWVEYNPCRCCPDSVLMKNGTWPREVVSYSRHKDSELTRVLKSMGWKLLDQKNYSIDPLPQPNPKCFNRKWITRHDSLMQSLADGSLVLPSEGQR